MANSAPLTVPDLFRHSRETWLESARSAARQLLKSRHTITVEDVMLICPRPSYIHRNTTGQIFKDDMFVAVGYTAAKKPTSNGRVIRLWALNEKYLPLQETDCDT